MQQTPSMTPMIMESLRRLDLIMPIKLFIPGIVPKETVSRQYEWAETAYLILGSFAG